MVDKLRQLAKWERDWGSLARWFLGIVGVLILYSFLHLVDVYYVRRAEFNQYTGSNGAVLTQINAKLDSLVSTVTQNTTRLQDIQHRLDRVENLQDEQRVEANADPESVAGK